MLVPIKERVRLSQKADTNKVADLEDLISENSNLPEAPKVMESIDSFANIKWKELQKIEEENKLEPSSIPLRRLQTPVGSSMPGADMQTASHLSNKRNIPS